MAKKTALSIYLDYQKSIRQAELLEDAARTIKSEKTDLHSCRSSISSAWEGDNATIYLNKVKIVENDLDRLAKSLKNTANVIRKIAKQTYDAEQHALKLAEKRNV